jgi:hypothetical protein
MQKIFSFISLALGFLREARPVRRSCPDAFMLMVQQSCSEEVIGPDFQQAEIVIALDGFPVCALH